MIQEDKDLLLKDLCARLPYGVKVECKWKTPAPNGTYGMICKLDSFLLDQIYNMNDSDVPFDEFKPYLFPMSSMTEEQRREQEAYFICIKHDMSFSICRYMEWCYKNNLDVNGLIPKGLAIDATNENIY